MGADEGLQGRYLRLIFDLLEAKAPTVVYEAASSLTSLTSNPVAVKAAATKFIELSIKESDNNVKLIVLDRMDQLRQRNEGVLDDLTMDVLRALSSPDMDVRKKALGIALEMVSSKNVEEVVMLLKKELSKTVDEQYEKVLCTLRSLEPELILSRLMSIGSFSSPLFINAPLNFTKWRHRSLICSWTSSQILMRRPPPMLFHLSKRLLNGFLSCGHLL